MGFDYTFAYIWPIYKPDQAIPMQLDYIRKTRDLNILPEVVTISQGWTGWRNEGPLYRIPPADFEGLLRQAKDILATMPQQGLSSKLLLLDNWNEWSEGHYLAPHRQYGFGYLDAVRKVFARAPEHTADRPAPAAGPCADAVRRLVHDASRRAGDCPRESQSRLRLQQSLT